MAKKKTSKEPNLKTAQLFLPCFLPGVDLMNSLEEVGGNLDLALGISVNQYLDVIGAINEFRNSLSFVPNELMEFISIETNGPIIFVTGPIVVIDEMISDEVLTPIDPSKLEVCKTEGKNTPLFNSKDIFKSESSSEKN